MQRKRQQERPARPAVGSIITLPEWGKCEVLPESDPALVRLQTEAGTTVRIGDKALRLALLAATGADVKPTR